MTAPAKDQKVRAADELVAQFEKQILYGALKAGSPLPPEREIVQAHSVSRTVVREAVRMLASKGLIRAQPGFRPIVAEPGYDAAVEVLGSIVTQLLGQPKGVRNLFDVRIRMEASLVRDAAKFATTADIAQLEKELEENRQAIDDSLLFYQTDIAFHGVLYEIPGNPALPSIHRAYTEWLSKQWRVMPRSPERNQTNYEAHKAIFDAILRRDPDKAEDAIRDHLEFAWRQVSSTFQDL